MKTNIHRYLFATIIAGLCSFSLPGGLAHAQAVSGIEVRKAKPGLKTAQLHHVSVRPSSAAPGEPVTIKARLEWSDIGRGWKPLPGKPVSCLVDYNNVNLPLIEVKVTDSDGWVSFTYVIPNNLPSNTRRAWVHLDFETDGAFKGDGVKEIIMIKR